MNLSDLGWNPFFAEAFVQYEGKDLIPGRVVVIHKDGYIIHTEQGEFKASAAGKMRYESSMPSEMPVVGDWVAVRTRQEENSAVIHAVLPRKTKLSRKVAGEETEEQILASNLDIAFWVTSLNLELNLRRIERFLTAVWDGGAVPVIILNKADLCDNTDEKTLQVESIAPGVTVIVTSALEGDGISEIGKYLSHGKTAAFLGSSGVGKSTIINKLVGRDVMKVSEIRDFDDKGRHTTSVRQMLMLENGGLVIDTPGIRELQLWDTDGSADTFEDLEVVALGCRFSDCTHENEPGCAVKKAVEEGIIDVNRYGNYIKMKKELGWIDRKIDRKAQLEEKKHHKILSKAIKKYYDIKNAEREEL